MIRVRGRIGDWPVDLSIELDADDWAHLAQALPDVAVSADAPSAPTAAPVDGLWPLAQDLLRQAGSLDGPHLLEQLQALGGGAQAGKRLLVRLRHSPQVRVEKAVYHWLG